MKKIFLILIVCLFTLQLYAQKPGILKNQVDAWGLTYTYTGEILNGKANGMGAAKYAGGNVLRYVGHFDNGFYNGKGIMFFDNGAFLSGTWSKGKLNGKGSNLTAEGTLYIGDFVNGVKSGQGVLFYKDKSFVKGTFSNDKMSGRCITIWASGSIISDVYFLNDQRNGTGFQYEAESKQLFQGEWKDDKWVQAATPGFTSFLVKDDFMGESTDDHVLIGPVTKDGYIKDTGYFFDKKKNKRYLGYYEAGFIKNGIQSGDSTKFIGNVDNIGAQGFCYDYKTGKYFSEGYFKDDKLDGEIMDVDFVKKSVYFGQAVAGSFTGKAYFFNEYSTMYAGMYVNGKFTGQGYRLEASGHCTTGIWEDGEATTVTSLITPKGDVITGTPKTFTEAINIIAKDYEDDYDNISGTYNDDNEDTELDEDWDDLLSENYTSLIHFPGTAKADKIITDFDSTQLYIITLLQTSDAAKAKAKFSEITKQLLATSITNKTLTAPTRFKGNTEVPDAEENTSVFELITTRSEYADFKVWLKMFKKDDDTYTVLLEIGKKNEMY